MGNGYTNTVYKYVFLKCKWHLMNANLTCSAWEIRVGTGNNNVRLHYLTATGLHDHNYTAVQMTKHRLKAQVTEHSQGWVRYTKYHI